MGADGRADIFAFTWTGAAAGEERAGGAGEHPQHVQRPYACAVLPYASGALSFACAVQLPVCGAAGMRVC